MTPPSANRPPAPPQQTPSRTLADIDAWYALAGLARATRASSRPARRKPASQASVAQLQRRASEPLKAGNGVQWLPPSGWDGFWAGFSTRKSGLSRAYSPNLTPSQLNLGFTAADDHRTVDANRRLFVQAVTGSADTPLFVVRQFHSNLIIHAKREDAFRLRPLKADGILTAEPGLLLAVQVADCIPVLVADRRKRVVAAFHAGWRGTLKRIVQLGVGRLQLDFGCDPRDMVAAIGPGIGPCCYSVGEDVVSGFESQFAYSAELFHEVYDADPVRQKYPMLFLTQRAPGHSEIGPLIHLDLPEANRRQLLDAGLEPSAIQIVGGCTSCQPDLFFSHRASHGHAGRLMAVIGVTL